MGINSISTLQIKTPAEIEQVCYFDDGTLFVAQDAIFDPRVIDYEMRLIRIGALLQKKQVSLLDIQNRNRNNETKRRIAIGQELRTAFDLLENGVKMKASDIHFVFRHGIVEIKFRIDGYLDKYAEIPADEGMSIVSALYVECDVKNSGGFTFNRPIAARLSKGLQEGLYAVRFASMKTDAGGVVVLRLLYNTVANRTYGHNIDLKTLGFDDTQEKILREMASAPNGIIIVNGPTGSGKSTTLKYALQWIHENYPYFNILTVEDPPEYPIEGAQQIPVLVQDSNFEDANARNRAYANVISTSLRLDPDILMVGEIRDGASAIAALRAAITGHRLWTTLHANDAWEAFNRMIDLLREGGMSNPMSVLANTQNVTGMIAQRLVPTLCPNCKVSLSECPERLSKEVLDELTQALPDFDARSIYLRGDGCKYCVPYAQNELQVRHAVLKGIIGRTAVAEVVHPDQVMLDVARSLGIPDARRFWLKHRGGRSIVDHALDKIRAGIIAPDIARDFIGPLVSSRQMLSGAAPLAYACSNEIE